MKLQIKRRASTDQGTFGVLLYDSIFFCYTGELPWKGNQQGISCIPEGNYVVEPWNSKKFPNTYHVKNVPNREAILIHTGNLCGDKSKNYLSHVLGCILVGEKTGTVRNQKAVLLSVVAMRHLRELIGRESFNLEVSWAQ